MRMHRICVIRVRTRLQGVPCSLMLSCLLGPAQAMLCAVQVMGLPPMIDISAGHSHLLMTDGERCFAMGSWLNGASDTKSRTEWGIPREQMQAPNAGIKQVRSYMHRQADRSCVHAVSSVCHVARWTSSLSIVHVTKATCLLKSTSDVRHCAGQCGLPGVRRGNRRRPTVAVGPLIVR